MADFTADFEAGVNGATLTTGGGEASATAYAFVNGTPQYSNTQAAHGSLSMMCNADNEWFSWNGVDPSDHYGRFYLYLTANPSGTVNVFATSNATDGITFNARVDNDGQITVSDKASAHTQTTTASISLNQWIRIEYRVIHSATVGQGEIKLFNTKDSITVTETLTTAANWDTGGSPNTSVRFGEVQGSSITTFWMDDILANATAYPGPAVTPSVENLAPVIYGRGAA